MQDIGELERRITAAMDRIAYGLEGRLAAQTPLHSDDGSAEIARLSEALDEERMANAQLNERLRVLREQDGLGQEALAAEAEALKAQLAAQTDEISTLRRVLAEAGKEIAALRAARAAEAEEMSDIVAALDPLVAQASTEGPHA